jgi:hypothetical protein
MTLPYSVLMYLNKEMLKPIIYLQSSDSGSGSFAIMNIDIGND